MTQLIILCEGHTERTYVAGVLGPHLKPHGVRAVHWNMQGLDEYADLQEEIDNWAADSRVPASYCTTMIDLYALPADFPGRGEARRDEQDAPLDHVRRLETCLARRVGNPRFVPYISLHEFEALLFTDITQLSVEFAEPHFQESIQRLSQVAASFPTPEHIDDDPQKAPSKRIIAELWQYEDRKARVGPQVAKAIGLERIRAACPHFSEWLAKLEELDRPPAQGDDDT